MCKNIKVEIGLKNVLYNVVILIHLQLLYLPRL